jgi:hypothetical protein
VVESDNDEDTAGIGMVGIARIGMVGIDRFSWQRDMVDWNCEEKAKSIDKLMKNCRKIILFV